MISRACWFRSHDKPCRIRHRVRPSVDADNCTSRTILPCSCMSESTIRVSGGSGNTGRPVAYNHSSLVGARWKPMPSWRLLASGDGKRLAFQFFNFGRAVEISMSFEDFLGVLGTNGQTADSSILLPTDGASRQPTAQAPTSEATQLAVASSRSPKAGFFPRSSAA